MGNGNDRKGKLAKKELVTAISLSENLDCGKRFMVQLTKLYSVENQ